MKKILTYKVKSNIQLNPTIYQMILLGDTDWIKMPGQFMEITVKNGYLKRPISICDFNEKELTIIYKVIGKGTKYMSSLKQNDELEALIGLGNGFDLTKVKDDLLLIGGGVGIPPLYSVCKEAIKLNKKPKVLLGFRTKDDAYYIEEFKKLNVEVYVSSEDGSIGDKANVVGLLNKYNLNDYDYCTCGPLKMMEAIYNNSTGHGLLSFEARMGCGFGACMGCSTKTKNGYKRICKEGPILDSEEVLWED